jgi:FAD/FMN-containing dehydrogenase
MNKRVFVSGILVAGDTAKIGRFACREQGGTLYPFAAVAMTRGDWERHYGEHLQALRKAKHRYDPANVFASGPDEVNSM